MSLTKRQKKILSAIIYEFLESASPVGSITISNKYDIGVSPATLRMEMAKLSKLGYLFKSHKSSGRLPTTLGMRYFHDQMLEERKISVVKIADIRERLFQRRFNRNRFLRDTTSVLSHLCGLAATSIVEDMIFYTGVGNLLQQPEFDNIELLQNLINIIESEGVLQNLFDKYSSDNGPITLIGTEIGMEGVSDCSIVFSPFNYYRGTKGYLAVLGPMRMHYAKIIPIIKYMTTFLEEAIQGWE